MPLIKRSSKAARAVNVRRLIDEGYPPRQAVAIAYATQRAARARNRAGGSMGAKAHRDAAIEAEKATRAQSGAAAVASSQAASDHARAAEAAAKASDSRTDFRAAAQAHDAAASAAWLVGDSARSERHTNAMDRAWRAATRAVNAAGSKRRNRAGVDVDTLARIARHARSVMREEFDGWVSLGKLRDPIGHAQVIRWLMERQNNRTDAAYKRNSERFGEREAAFRKGMADEAYDLLSDIMSRLDPAYVASLKKSNKAGGKQRKPSARSYAERLRSNADDFHSYRIDYETFSDRNKRIWSEVNAAGKKVHEGVLRLLREEAGKAPARR